jgi:hypothetical protein
MLVFGLYRRVDLYVDTNVSEEHTVSTTTQKTCVDIFTAVTTANLKYALTLFVFG